jgi:hypothetical protein
MSNTAFTRIRTCALAIGAVCFIGSQALAQGGPNVTVVNTPLPVTMSGTPVAFTLGNTGTFLLTTTVPTAQRLVIEYVSGQCDTGGLTFAPKILLLTHTSGVPLNHSFAPASPVAAANIWQMGQVVKIYADQGTSISVDLLGLCFLTFSGLLVSP